MIERLGEYLKQQWLKRNGLVWFVIHVLAAVAGFALSIWQMYHYAISEAESFILGGYALGMMVCAALYCGWIARDKDKEDRAYGIFLLMITECEMICMLNICFIGMNGRMPYRIALLTVKILSEILHVLYFFLFWGYFLYFMQLDRSVVRRKILFARILFFVTVLFHVTALWNKEVFSVNPDKTISYGRWYWLSDLFMIYIVLAVTVTMLQIRNDIRRKILVLTIELLPLVIYVSTLEISRTYHSNQPAVYIIPLVVTNAIYLDLQRRERFRKASELGAAALIQSSMLPQDFTDHSAKSRYELYASMDPAREIGGDFYDFFMVDEDHLALVIADVSDKGVPAALFAMTARTLLRQRAMQGGSLSETVSWVNDQLLETNSAKQFVTVWMMVICLSTGEAAAVNAGHTKPAFAPAFAPYSFVRHPHSFVMGVRGGVRFSANTWQFQKGDRLFVYTDGVTEAKNLKMEEFGPERMLKTLNECGTPSQKELLAHVGAQVAAFAEGAVQYDDITMLGFTYLG